MRWPIVLETYKTTSTETWRSPALLDWVYLHRLVEWGYRLSDIEATVAGEGQLTKPRHAAGAGAKGARR